MTIHLYILNKDLIMFKMPKTMKAAVLTKLKEPLEILNISMPKNLEVGQVLVKIHFSGICGSQIGEIEGVKGDDKYLPHLLGHEASGTVLSVGQGVKHVKVSDRVVLHWRKSMGIEANSPNFKFNRQKINAGGVTTFSEYTIVSENRLTKIPDNSDLKIAALFGCAVTTGFGVVENNGKIKIGESLVVYGSGGIGLSIVQAANLVSAFPIIAIDIYDNKLDLAKKLGATHIINSQKQNVEDTIKKITHGSGVDVFIDNTGSTNIIELGYKLTKTDGRVVLVGVPKNNNNINIFSLPLHFGKKIIGSHGGDCSPQIDIPRYYNLYINRKINLCDLITNTFKLEDINLAIRKMKSGEISGRCMIEM